MWLDLNVLHNIISDACFEIDKVKIFLHSSQQFVVIDL